MVQTRLIYSHHAHPLYQIHIGMLKQRWGGHVFKHLLAGGQSCYFSCSGSSALPPFLNILTYLDSEIASIRIYWLAQHNERKNFDQAHIVPSGGYCYPLHA